MRGYLISLVPKAIMLATAGGIGLFLAFIGLQQGNGLGVVTADAATLVTLGECPLWEASAAPRRGQCTPVRPWAPIVHGADVAWPCNGAEGGLNRSLLLLTL